MTRCAIAGVDVGQSASRWQIDGDRVKVGFTLGGHQIGTDSRVAIRTDTILGKRVTSRSSRAATKPLRANGVLPVGQTTTPYQIYDAFFDLHQGPPAGTSTRSSSR